MTKFAPVKVCERDLVMTGDVFCRLHPIKFPILQNEGTSGNLYVICNILGGLGFQYDFLKRI